ncbi:uncharacterized protein FOMMEDRAFT_23983 [Fomitiporia mediterranea MF3/22]|uniref:uncharacterized protein n=1 Tax=Fomitiporia mediterranea (strain MF3/22) TaxID=694068 RepID=UPI0004407944|nr:uncharacterized protein FOMMEDRAFT_23983 [Fomitiporia mediterranea MF3/22]EJC97934.1 hypothetical protein FOMMEDRAFT_23983 [Fomitiporia mediterranea MF3/22]
MHWNNGVMLLPQHKKDNFQYYSSNFSQLDPTQPKGNFPASSLAHLRLPIIRST